MARLKTSNGRAHQRVGQQQRRPRARRRRREAQQAHGRRCVSTACSSVAGSGALVQPVIQQNSAPDSSARTLSSTHCSRCASARAVRRSWRSASGRQFGAARALRRRPQPPARRVDLGLVAARSLPSQVGRSSACPFSATRLLRQRLQLRGRSQGQRVALAAGFESAQQRLVPPASASSPAGQTNSRTCKDGPGGRGLRQVDDAVGQLRHHHAPTRELGALGLALLPAADQRLGRLRPGADVGRCSARAWPAAVRGRTRPAGRRRASTRRSAATARRTAAARAAGRRSCPAARRRCGSPVPPRRWRPAPPAPAWRRRAPPGARTSGRGGAGSWRGRSAAGRPRAATVHRARVRTPAPTAPGR